MKNILLRSIFITAFTLPLTTQSFAQMGAMPLSKHVVSYKGNMSEYQAKLFEQAYQKITNGGFTLIWDTRQSLQSFINDGVKLMYQQGLTGDTYRDSSEHYIDQFAAAMVEDAQKRGTSGKLDMMSFRAARAILCPKWPFCVR